jgi:hypothetical protein
LLVQLSHLIADALRSAAPVLFVIFSR